MDLLDRLSAIVTPEHWELYKWYIMGAVSLIIGQAALISWLLALRTARRRAEWSTTAADSIPPGLVQTASGWSASTSASGCSTGA